MIIGRLIYRPIASFFISHFINNILSKSRDSLSPISFPLYRMTFLQKAGIRFLLLASHFINNITSKSRDSLTFHNNYTIFSPIFQPKDKIFIKFHLLHFILSVFLKYITYYLKMYTEPYTAWIFTGVSHPVPFSFFNK